jgi:CRP-like cAMP-binding protein
MVPSYFVLPIEEVGKDDQRAENSRRGDQMQTARFPPSQVTTGDSSEFPIMQAAVADALGLSTVHVNRSLMELRGQGLIILEKQTLTVPSWRKLHQYAGFNPHYLHMETPAEVP